MGQHLLPPRKQSLLNAGIRRGVRSNACVGVAWRLAVACLVPCLLIGQLAVNNLGAQEFGRSPTSNPLMRVVAAMGVRSLDHRTRFAASYPHRQTAAQASFNEPNLPVEAIREPAPFTNAGVERPLTSVNQTPLPPSDMHSSFQPAETNAREGNPTTNSVRETQTANVPELSNAKLQPPAFLQPATEVPAFDPPPSEPAALPPPSDPEPATNAQTEPASKTIVTPEMRRKKRGLSVVIEAVDAEFDGAPLPPTKKPVVVAPSSETKTEAKPANKSEPETKQVAAQLEALPPPRKIPFEVVEEVGELTVVVRRSKLLKLNADVYRTAIVDPAVCDIVQFSPRELSVIGKGIGATHLTFWFEGGDGPQTLLVTVAPDEKVKELIAKEYQQLEDLIARLFPNSKVVLSVLADKLVVQGQAKDSEEATQIMSIIRNQAAGGTAGVAGVGTAGGTAARVLSEQEAGSAATSRPQLQVVNMLRVPGVQQVALRVKIAELNRSAARGFGVDVSGKVNFTNNPKGSQLFLQSILNMTTGGSGSSLLTQFDGDDIQVGLRYLQQHGVVRLVSEPTVVTMSGTPATFIAGGEFAVPTVVGSAGLNAVTTDFRSFGAIINFVPTVLDKDRIRLQVSPEFSQVNRDLAVGGTPGLNVRSVTTTVEMREGQTLAIAGLLEDNMKSGTRGNLPFLATVLGSRDVTRSETELLILVTPELIHPMDPEEVPPLPGFDITEPNNHEFFIKGKIEGKPTADYRSTVWPRLRSRYNSGGSSMISGPFGHGQ